MKHIYLDNAATTKIDKEVFEAMKPYLLEEYANPSAVYNFATDIRDRISASRRRIATFLSANEEEIYFTSGGSEADNWAIQGIADAYSYRGKHIITTEIEHHAVLNTCRFLEKHGFEVTYLKPDKYGMISPASFEAAICPDTILASIMLANNEIGTIEPIAELGAIAHRKGVIFHTDAVQAFGHIRIDVDAMNIDLLSASAHKLNGPKGVGMLYVRNGINITSLIHGGSQELGKRAGTLNTAGIIGFGKAVELADKSLEHRQELEQRLRNRFIDRALAEIPDIRLNGHPELRLPNNINISLKNISGESLLLLLNQKGICVSSGAACTAGSLEVSHVLAAIGAKDEFAGGTIRITLSSDNTEEEMDFTLDTLKMLAEKLRACIININMEG